jgi:hypothetical protein
VQEIADAGSRLFHDDAEGPVTPGSIIQREVFVQQDQTEKVGGDRAPGENAPALPAPEDPSPDSEERIGDFLARHGGAGQSPRREGREELGARGWYEVPAADGYRLRCEWSRMGSRAELRYFEISPEAKAGTESPR